MSEPNQPIQLDYKTPEKGEPVSFSVVVDRLIMGAIGLFSMFIALILSLITLVCFGAGIGSREWDLIVAGPVLAVFAYLTWTITIGLLRYTIKGNRKSNDLPTNQ